MNRITSNHFAMGIALGLQIPMAAFSAGSDSATPSAPQVEAMEYNLSLSDLMNLKVVTASKAEEPIDEAPNVMYVISREDIRRRGYNTSMDGSNNDLDLSLTSYSAEVAVQHEIPDKNFFQLGFQGVEKQIRHNYDFVWDPDKPYTFYSHRRDSLGNLLDSMRLDKMRAIVKPSETHAAGMYVSNKFKANQYLKIITAFRLDRDEILDAGNTLFFDADKLYLSPRLAAIVTPASDLVLKLMYNRATRLAQAPQATPLNNIWGIENRGLGPDWATQNPTISRPEILNTWEAQLIYYAFDSRLTLNYWHQELSDFTSWFSPWTNVGDFTGNGFEYEIVSPILPGVSLWTNGALSDNNFEIVADANKAGEGTEAGSAFQLPANN
ncbi:MAG TPA: TonB-dependent receptor, partial [Fibrobacteria bacterium]|nr:TonB-dependent receptor [Fibrobacteria bacterium]